MIQTKNCGRPLMTELELYQGRGFADGPSICIYCSSDLRVDDLGLMHTIGIAVIDRAHAVSRQVRSVWTERVPRVNDRKLCS